MYTVLLLWGSIKELPQVFAVGINFSVIHNYLYGFNSWFIFLDALAV